MKAIIDSSTVRAIKFNSDGATKHYYNALKEGRFQSTQCQQCNHIPFPPRMFCPQCGSTDIQWIDLPKQGTLYAFTQQSRALRFNAPDVIGLVSLPDIGMILTKIDAPIEQLSIGQTVEWNTFKVDDRLTVHQFHPIT